MTNSSLFLRLIPSTTLRPFDEAQDKLCSGQGSGHRITLLTLVLVFWLGLHSPIGSVEANSPLAALSSSPTPQLVWEGRIVSDIPNVTPPNGSILRVSVEGLKGVPITVSAYDWSTTALSGSKTEYGPYMAEFAPLQPGFYTVSVESLEASLEITANGTNLIVVEFTQVYRVLPTPTPTPLPSPSPTPQLVWEGRIVSDIPNATPPNGSILRVSVEGLKGVPITVSAYDWSTTALSGSKTEYGPYMAEFAPLQPGFYTVSVESLEASLEITANGTNLIVVEFTQVYRVLPTPALTPSPSPSPTPRPPSWTTTPMPLVTATPTATSSPALQPVSIWVGSIVRQVSGTGRGISRAAIAVRVVDKWWLPVEIRSGGWSTTALTGSKPEYGDTACEFGALSAGTYTITPQGLDASVTVTVDEGGFALVEFVQRPLSPTSTPTTVPTVPLTPTLLPPTPASSESVTSKPSPPAAWIPLPGLPASIPSHVGPPVARASLPGLPTSIPIDTGSPARRMPLPSLPHSIRGQASFPRAPLANLPAPTPTASAVISTPVPMPSLTATPAPRWMAQALRNTGGDVLGWRSSVIAVQVIGLKNLPVELRSGSFSVTAFTGSKPDYGEFACEFGGLSAGTYEVIPQGLGVSQTITVDGGGFALIEFAYRLPPTPTPIAPKVTWVGKVVSNSSGQGANGIFSVVVVRVLGAKGLPVEISSGGWNAVALTGTKPEYGPFACEFGGLWAGTYIVRPQGLGASVELTMDGQGLAIVEFTAH